ncbi:MAG: DUF4012 domain-containing protein [Pseudobutyrivibrio sp.]|nr:DUF4012 domain-containing protein [Pseudobutyrivibrio sp.]
MKKAKNKAIATKSPDFTGINGTRKYSKKSKVAIVLLSILFALLVFTFIAEIKIIKLYDDYYASAMTLMADANELKTSIKHSVAYLKTGNADAADIEIAKVESSIDSLKTSLADEKWDKLGSFPFIGKEVAEDLETVDKALNIADEATETVLKPTSSYLHKLGMPDVSKIDINNMGPEMADRLYGYSDMIDDICPAAEKVMSELNELPRFNIDILESKVSQYRELPQQTAGVFPVLEDTSSKILRPAADVMSKTPFSSVKADKGLNVRVLKEYIDLMDKIKPDLVDISGKLMDISLIKEDPKRAEKVSIKVSSLLDMISEFETYKPLIDIVVDGNDKTFVVVAQNNSEMRALGGFPGSIGTATVKDGIFSFGKFKDIVSVISDHHAKSIKISSIENKLFLPSWYGYSPRKATCNPDYPRAAEILCAAYEEKNKKKVDGVITLTPHIIQRMMSITGPIKLSNGKKLDVNNTVSYLQRQIYIDYFKNTLYYPQRVTNANNKTNALFAETADSVFTKLMDHTDKDSLLKLMFIMKESAKDRVFMMWMKNPEDQAVLSSLGLSGELNKDPENPVIGVFYSVNHPNRLGAYVDYTVSVGDGTTNENGTISYPVTVVLSNNLDKQTLKIGRGNPYITTSNTEGYMGSLIYFYAPAGGTVSGFKNNAKVKVSIEKYKELQLGFGSNFKLYPGKPITFTYTVTTAPGVTKKPEVMTQPLIWRDYIKN